MNRCESGNEIQNRNDNIRKNISIIIRNLIIIIIIASNINITIYANEEQLELYAQSAVLMDGESGRVLYSKDGDTALANASTTKIMTCILALEYGDMDRIVVASSNAAIQPEVHMGVKEGEEYYLEDLLYALMLESYNDSAVMIAESISGSVEAFAELMNGKALEIGCEDTYFITPNGLDAEDEIGFHHTTASDLALIMKYCLVDSAKSEEFLEITQTLNYSFEDVNNTRDYTCTNHNTLLQTNEDAISGKTGFTNDAGYCYVGAIESEGRIFIISLLACGWPYNRTYKWTDASTMFDYATENYNIYTLDSSTNSEKIENTVLQDVIVENAKTMDDIQYANLGIVESESVDVLKKDTEEIKSEVNFQNPMYAPLEEGTVVGSVAYILENEVVKVDTITVLEEINKETIKWCIYKYLTKTLML